MTPLQHAQDVLRRCRLVLHVLRVDFGAVFQQILRDLHSGSEMQRRLAARSPRSHHLWIDGDELCSSESRPSRAEACASSTAPRSIKKSAIASPHSSSTLKPPDHKSPLVWISAPERSSTSMVAGLPYCTAASSGGSPP